MSLFDNDIIYKDPQEIIWNWLENHYPGDADDLKEALEIDKDNYINVKKRWILKNIEFKTHNDQIEMILHDEHI